MQLQISISNRLVFYFIIGGVTAQNIVINYQTSKMAEGLYHIEDNEVLISSSLPPLLLTEPPVLILSASSSSAAAGAASKIKPTPATSMVLQTQKVTQQVHNSAASSASVTQQISVKDSVNLLSQITVEDSVTNDESTTILSKDGKTSTTLTSSINDLFTSCTLTSN